MRKLLVAMALTLLVGAACASGKPPKPHGQPVVVTQQEQPGAAQQPTKQDTRGTRESPFVVDIPKTKSESDADQEERRERSDAYRDTTLVGWVTVSVLAVQLIAFFWQGIQLKRTVGEMKTATIATKRVARAALQTSKTLQRSGRALVAIDAAEMDGWPSQPMTDELDYAVPRVKFQLRNCGSTPAFLKGCSYSFVLIPRGKKLDDAPNYKPAQPLEHIPLANGSPRNQHAPLDSIVYEADRIAANEGKSDLVFFGFVKYDDIYGNDCETRFCMWWTGFEPEPRWVYFGPPAYHLHS